MITRRHTRLAAFLLLAACSGTTSSSPPSSSDPSAAPVDATAVREPPAPPPAEPVDDGANFASPKQADEPQPAAPGGPPDPELAARVQERFGKHCKYERACGELVGVDCGAAVDGPYYYATRKDLQTVATCGGACRRGCTDCPPKAWTCPTY